MSIIGDMIKLKNQEVEVVACEDCGAAMVWLKSEDLAPGDLTTLKREGIRMTNEETDDQVCIDCELKREESEREKKKKVNDWFNSSSSSSHNDSDSGFFGGGGGFGGFGGGSFSGGGASGGW